jgi:hypothetical protein
LRVTFDDGLSGEYDLTELIGRGREEGAAHRQCGTRNLRCRLPSGDR